MRRHCAILSLGILLLVSLLVVPQARGQRPTALISSRNAARVGLERAWFTQAAISGFSGRILNLVEHVSSTEARYVAEVTWADGRILFRDSDLDAFQRPLEQEGAKRRADELVARLTAEGLTPALTEHVTPVITVYVATEGGNVQAIDGETGQTLWISTTGSAFHPTLPCGVGEKYVATVNGSTLYVLDRKTGNTRWSVRTRGVPGAGPAVRDEFVFVPMVDGTLEAYTRQDPTEPVFTYKATGRALIQPVTTPSSVVWPTDRGHLYVAWAGRHGLRYRVETEKPILSAPGYVNGKLYLSSLDGYIYCIQDQGGMVLWTLSTGEPISSTPLAIGDTVYAVTDSGSLVAANANTGQLLPGTSGISSLLGASAQRLYCTGERGELIVLDRATRTPVASLYMPGVEYRFTNHQTDRIYLANSNGMLQCFHEVGADFPLLHVDLAERTPPEQPAEAPAEDAESTPMPEPAAPTSDPFADPFGGGAEEPATDDPFGGGAAEPASEDPFGGGAEPATEDPFGSP